MNSHCFDQLNQPSWTVPWNVFKALFLMAFFFSGCKALVCILQLKPNSTQRNPHKQQGSQAQNTYWNWHIKNGVWSENTHYTDRTVCADNRICTLLMTQEYYEKICVKIHTLHMVNLTHTQIFQICTPRELRYAEVFSTYSDSNTKSCTLSKLKMYKLTQWQSPRGSKCANCKLK